MSGPITPAITELRKLHVVYFVTLVTINGRLDVLNDIFIFFCLSFLSKEMKIHRRVYYVIQCVKVIRSDLLPPYCTYFRGILVGFVILMFLKDLRLPVISTAVDIFLPWLVTL